MKWKVYIAHCSDGSFYTGITTNLEERMQVHNSGKGAKYTAPRLPLTLAWHQEFADRSTASKREYEIKQLSRTQKLKLINLSS